MDKESVVDALQALTKRMETRTKIGQLREVYPYIKEAKNAGHKNSEIVQTLNAQGFDLTLKSFEMMLYRLREEAKASAANAPRNSPSHFQPEKGAHQNLPRSPTHSLESTAAATNQGPANDGLVGLDMKQRRERLADLFITPNLTNPLLKRIKDQKQ